MLEALKLSDGATVFGGGGGGGVGLGLGDGFGLGDGEGLGFGVGDGEGLGLGDPGGEGLGLGDPGVGFGDVPLGLVLLLGWPPFVILWICWFTVFCRLLEPVLLSA